MMASSIVRYARDSVTELVLDIRETYHKSSVQDIDLMLDHAMLIDF